MKWFKRRTKTPEQVAIAAARREGGHRLTAYNCVLWFGDNHPVDWGTCPRCPEEKAFP